MKIFNLKSLFIALIMGLALSSCTSTIAGGLVGATGKPGEVMLVMDKEYYDTSIGSQLVHLLEVSAPALPQDEPMFRLSRVNTQGFKSFMKLVRNILIINVDEKRFTEPKLKYNYDEWARGQLVIRINTPSMDKLSQFLVEKEAVLINLILRHELYRFVDFLKKNYSSRASELTDSLFSYKINVPRDIIHHKVGENFLWMSNALMRGRHDLLIYSYPYTNKKDLELKRMIQVRDSVLKKNIVGEFEGTYPATAELPAMYRIVNLKNDSPLRSEMRGLWEMRGGAMMGGPFVSQSFLDKKTNRVLVVEGFVYNPNKDKLNLIRTMEASLYTFRPKNQKIKTSDILKTSFSRSYWSE